jgi:hypothetical protein
MCVLICIYVWLSSKKYKIVLSEKKEFEDLENLLIIYTLFCNRRRHLMYLYHVYIVENPQKNLHVFVL